jgi:hypothetical protein
MISFLRAGREIIRPQTNAVPGCNGHNTFVEKEIRRTLNPRRASQTAAMGRHGVEVQGICAGLGKWEI